MSLPSSVTFDIVQSDEDILALKPKHTCEKGIMWMLQ